jgi:hypothetical protein
MNQSNRAPGSSAEDIIARGEIVNRTLNDPPRVHIELGNPDGGVWRTDADCYDFLGSICSPGTRTLETGLGISTALFLALEASHTCVTPFHSEADRFMAYCRDRRISTQNFTLLVGESQRILPTLTGELDVVLIDGGHAFPLPMIDWYYGAGRLQRSGVVVIDDIHLPGVKVLTRYLDADPRWQPMQRTAKWCAYRRLSGGPLRDEWTDQPFYTV